MVRYVPGIQDFFSINKNASVSLLAYPPSIQSDSKCFFFLLLLPYHHFLCFLIIALFFRYNISFHSSLQNGVGDANDIWKIMVFGGRENETILTVTSKLVFIHYLQHCVLTASGQQLPKWGFEQQEVSCNPNLRDKNAHWNVEDNVFAKCTTTIYGSTIPIL